MKSGILSPQSIPGLGSSLRLRRVGTCRKIELVSQSAFSVNLHKCLSLGTAPWCIVGEEERV